MVLRVIYTNAFGTFFSSYAHFYVLYELHVINQHVLLVSLMLPLSATFTVFCKIDHLSIIFEYFCFVSVNALYRRGKQETKTSFSTILCKINGKILFALSTNKHIKSTKLSLAILF